MMHPMKKQNGNAGLWIFWIIVVIGVVVFGYLLAVKSGIFPAPDALKDIPLMATFLPEEPEEDIGDTQEVTEVDSLKQQLVFINGEKMALEAQIRTLEQDVADLQSKVTEREDEIARLLSTINLAGDQNITNVALIFENMDPTEASDILSNLGADRASLILSNMRESKAADVLEEMDEMLATEVTELMAGFE
jgi:flagellar motility protein MotE (MotC chaperone)